MCRVALKQGLLRAEACKGEEGKDIDKRGRRERGPRWFVIVPRKSHLRFKGPESKNPRITWDCVRENRRFSAGMGNGQNRKHKGKVVMRGSLRHRKRRADGRAAGDRHFLLQKRIASFSTCVRVYIRILDCISPGYTMRILCKWLQWRDQCTPVPLPPVQLEHAVAKRHHGCAVPNEKGAIYFCARRERLYTVIRICCPAKPCAKLDVSRGTPPSSTVAKWAASGRVAVGRANQKIPENKLSAECNVEGL